MAFPLGQAIRLATGTITGPTGPADPATLTLTITLPDGTKVVHPIADLTYDSLGNYHYDYLPTLPGDYQWTFVATVPNASADGAFTVGPIAFTRIPSGYLTVAEFKAMPTRLAVDQLVVNATAQMETAALADILARASQWADTYCQGPLGAQAQTLLRQTQTNIQGDAHIAVGLSPKVPVTPTSVSWGTLRTALTALSDLSSTFADRGIVTVGIGGYTGTWRGALQFGTLAPGGKIWISLGLITGWPSTITTVDQNAGDTSLTVSNPTGITAGQVLSLTNPGVEETVTVQSVTTNVLTLTTGLQNAQNAGCGVTAIPSDIREAVAYAACARIVTPGAEAVNPNAQAASKTKASKVEDTSYLGQARALLDPYRRRLP